MPKRGASQTHQNHTIMERSRDRDRRWRSSMVEQLICNQQVAGSSPIASSVEQRAQGANELFGRVPERSKGTDCKSVATGFEGSNPSPTTVSECTTRFRKTQRSPRGSSSVGRAPAFQAGRRGFETRLPLPKGPKESTSCPRSSVGRARPW